MRIFIACSIVFCAVLALGIASQPHAARAVVYDRPAPTTVDTPDAGATELAQADDVDFSHPAPTPEPTREQRLINLYAPKIIDHDTGEVFNDCADPIAGVIEISGGKASYTNRAYELHCWQDRKKSALVAMATKREFAPSPVRSGGCSSGGCSGGRCSAYGGWGSTRWR